MDPIEPASTDSSSVVATLRQFIVQGRLAAGERLAEIPVAQSLGVSRTPVRLAFRALEQEGLLSKAGKRGFEVRSFSEADVRSAIEVRGTLEGLAARHLAERGVPLGVREQLAQCIADGAALLAKGHLVDEDIGHWSRVNKRFHDALVEAHESRVIADAIARNNHLPFASADSIALDRSALPAEYEKLRIAQLQHQLVVDALDRRESARAEMLMREHAWVGFRYGRLFGLEDRRLAAGQPPLRSAFAAPAARDSARSRVTDATTTLTRAASARLIDKEPPLHPTGKGGA